jgi:hypothetical protein
LAVKRFSDHLTSQSRRIAITPSLIPGRWRRFAVQHVRVW